MKIIRVSLLVIALAGAVYAGEMPCGVASPGNMPNGVTSSGGIPSGGIAPGEYPIGGRVEGEIPNDGRAVGEKPSGVTSSIMHMVALLPANLLVLLLPWRC